LCICLPANVVQYGENVYEMKNKTKNVQKHTVENTQKILIDFAISNKFSNEDFFLSHVQFLVLGKNTEFVGVLCTYQVIFIPFQGMSLHDM
jgi:hypothetical protein